MNEEISLTIRDVMNNAKDLPWSYSLYLPAGRSLDLSTPCLVLDPDAGEGDIPTRALELGFEYALGMQQIQSIVRNAQQQRSLITDDDLLTALRYYYENDAFIEF